MPHRNIATNDDMRQAARRQTCGQYIDGGLDRRQVPVELRRDKDHGGPMKTRRLKQESRGDIPPEVMHGTAGDAEQPADHPQPELVILTLRAGGHKRWPLWRRVHVPAGQLGNQVARQF